MQQQIVRFSLHQSSKLIAFIYLLLCFMSLLTLGIAALVGDLPSDVPSLPVAVGYILLYGLVAYVFFFATFAFYNLVARFVGGIEVTVSTSNEEPKGQTLDASLSGPGSHVLELASCRK